MVAPATTEYPREPVAIDHERILWDADYRREIIQRLKRLDKTHEGKPRVPAGRHAA